MHFKCKVAHVELAYDGLGSGFVVKGGRKELISELCGKTQYVNLGDENVCN